MRDRGPYRVPPTSALIAFECAARHGNFSRAARELRTSQSAISRHIASLEKRLSIRLFERSRTGVKLTDAGSRYRDAVAIGLGAIHAGAAEVADLAGGDRVEIAIGCSDEVSQLFLLPHYDALRDTLGEQVRVRILTYHYSVEHLPSEPAADVLLTWNADAAAPEDRALIFREAVWPVCSPGYAALHADTLRGPVTGWDGPTFLDLARPNEGWLSWDDWFETVGRPDTPPRYIDYDSYMYVLEAAAAGKGIALNWRHFAEQFLESGALVALTDQFLETDNRFYAVLTEKGRRRPLGRQCLAFFESLV